MKLLICSDSHGNLEYVEKIIDIAKNQAIDTLLHLGDDYSDAEPICDQGISCIRVPGTWSQFYQNPVIENRRVEIFEGWICVLSHTPTKDYHDLVSDPDPIKLCKESNAHFFFHGHTHKPEIVLLESGVYRINPGHIKAEIDRGYQASFAIMTATQSSCSIQIQSLLNLEIIHELFVNK